MIFDDEYTGPEAERTERENMALDLEHVDGWRPWIPRILSGSVSLAKAREVYATARGRQASLFDVTPPARLPRVGDMTLAGPYACNRCRERPGTSTEDVVDGRVTKVVLVCDECATEGAA